MKPSLLPTVERAARFALHRGGFKSLAVPTSMGRLHAYEAKGHGNLPTTAVLHGIGSAASSFGLTLAHLRPHVRRVVAPDLPGHGFSASPAGRLTPTALFGSVRAALDTLADEPMVLVGNSLGGALALRYAMESPDRVHALVLVSPAGARTTEEEWSALVRAFKIESVAEARSLLGRLYHRTPWYIPALAPGFCDVMKRRAIRDILDSATLDDLPDPGRLRDLPMPVLLLWGQSERVLPASSLEYFRRHLPAQACIEEPAGFGHCPHIEDPRALAARIVDFAQTSLPSQPPTGYSMAIA